LFWSCRVDVDNPYVLVAEIVLVVWVVISSPSFAVCLSNSMVASNVLYYYVNCDRIIVNHIYVMPPRTLPPIILCLTWTSVHVDSY